MLFYFFKLINKARYDMYNLTGNSITTIFNLAKLISKINSSKLISPKKNNSVPGAVKYINISSKRLKKEYKLKNTSIDYGLKKTIDWYKSLLNLN